MTLTKNERKTSWFFADLEFRNPNTKSNILDSTGKIQMTEESAGVEIESFDNSSIRKLGWAQ